MADTHESLATTKRKFHKLLDNITNNNASTTSLASTLRGSNASTASLSNPLTPEPPSKRPRSSGSSMDERRRSISASQARIQALKAQLLTPKRQGTVRVVGQTATPAVATPRKAPNFQPHSQEQFLGRLKTFADIKKWTSKPDSINEVEWAKRGWTCDAWNTVACRGGCEKRVAVKLRPKRKDADGKALELTEDMAVDIDEKLVDKFKDLIESGHGEECLWRKRGCQDNIYHLPVTSRAQTIVDFLDRYNSFKTVIDDLPSLENITYPDPSIEDIIQLLPLHLFRAAGAESPPVPPEAPQHIVAFTFALFGWHGLCESRISLAACNHCFQRLGLWLSTDSRLKEMSKKLDVPLESLRLNLLESHREHCPWKNALLQANPLDGPIANMAAWQTLQFIVLNRRKESPNKARGHGRNIESVDLGSEAEYPRGSIDSWRHDDKDREDETGKLQEKWKKFKAKLRRTTSMKSVKSVKSIKSVKSGKSTTTVRTGADQA